MAMIIGRERLDRSLVTPWVPFHVTIDKGNHSSVIVPTAGEEQEHILLHLHAKIGPANAVGIDVGKQKKAGGACSAKLGLLFEHGVIRGQPVVPMPGPTEVRVHRVTAQLRVRFSREGYGLPVGWTN